MKKWKKIFAIVLIIFGSVLFINPNPFGNQPTAVSDETYFLATAVKAIQEHTLPGFVADPTGAYYGGILTYINFAVVLCIGAVLFISKMHAAAISSWIAFHWGDLLHIGRIVNGLAIYLTLLWIGWKTFLLSKEIKKPSFAWFGFFVINLLCGSSLFLPIVHTSKWWAIYLSIELLAAWLVFSQEWKREQGADLLEKKSYVNRLILLAILSWSQVLFASLTFLWILDALLLKHISLADLLKAFKRPFVWITLAIAVPLNYSFAVNFFAYVRNIATSDNLTGLAIASSHPWLTRILWPFKTLFFTHPLLSVMFAGAILLFFFQRKILDKNKKRLSYVVFLHAILTYVIFNLIFGFYVDARYALPFTFAATIFTALTFMDVVPWRKTIGAICGLLALCVLIKTAWLFWNPSSLKVLQQKISQASISSGDLLITSSHFQFSVLNAPSIQFTEQYSGTPVFRRYALLVNDPRYAHLAPPYTVSVGEPKNADYSKFTGVWIIDEDLKHRCGSTTNTCIEINVPQRLASTDWVAEGSDIASLFQTNMIGRAYTLKKVNEIPKE
ncbi:MAG: hypothetical protein WC477_00160 [Patescibacteria group bacterium]